MDSLCSVPQLAHPTVVPASCVFSVEWILKESGVDYIPAPGSVFDQQGWSLLGWPWRSRLPLLTHCSTTFLCVLICKFHWTLLLLLVQFKRKTRAVWLAGTQEVFGEPAWSQPSEDFRWWLVALWFLLMWPAVCPLFTNMAPASCLGEGTATTKYSYAQNGPSSHTFPGASELRYV